MNPEVVNWVKSRTASVRVLPSPRIGATPGPFVKQMNIHQMIYWGAMENDAIGEI